jgi:hypothetical protein
MHELMELSANEGTQVTKDIQADENTQAGASQIRTATAPDLESQGCHFACACNLGRTSSNRDSRKGQQPDSCRMDSLRVSNRTSWIILWISN